ncbi:MAG: hypothetical protein PHP98_11275 [Kiritimatiellae bacterium]|nr:hypothetical protein [Kiritimatiellia bacterium]
MEKLLLIFRVIRLVLWVLDRNNNGCPDFLERDITDLSAAAARPADSA